jgi:ribonuclease P protein component
MLAKNNRLNTDLEIKRLIRSGKTFFLPQLTFKYSANQDKDIKIGFIVSNKVDKRATKRNLLKRRLREANRSFLKDLKPGHNLLIIAKKSALDLSFVELKKQIEFAYNQIRLLNKKS